VVETYYMVFFAFLSTLGPNELDTTFWRKDNIRIVTPFLTKGSLSICLNRR
jgi:hypothetical protein